MVYGMTQRNGGRLEIESAIGKGTTVRLVFPLATVAPTAALAGVSAQLQY
jgi:signal transduction histidine kinase